MKGEDHEGGVLDAGSSPIRRAGGDGTVKPESRADLRADQDSAACDCDAGSSDPAEPWSCRRSASTRSTNTDNASWPSGFG